MICWIECRTRHAFIAAIVAVPAEAARVFAAMPEAVQRVSAIHSRADLAWPCFLVEDDEGFWFCSPDEAESRIASNLAAGKLDDEDRVITVYRLSGEFHPEVPGSDEMGRIDHFHPGAREAARIAEKGLRASESM